MLPAKDSRRCQSAKIKGKLKKGIFEYEAVLAILLIFKFEEVIKNAIYMEVMLKTHIQFLYLKNYFCYQVWFWTFRSFWYIGDVAGPYFRLSSSYFAMQSLNQEASIYCVKYLYFDPTHYNREHWTPIIFRGLQAPIRNTAVIGGSLRFQLVTVRSPGLSCQPSHYWLRSQERLSFVAHVL